MVDLYSKKGKSTPQKIIILLLEILMLIISYWILFSGGYLKIFPSASLIHGNEIRHLILFGFNLIVFLRLCITIFYLIKRQIPWEETFSIPFAFAIYYIGFSLLINYFGDLLWVTTYAIITRNWYSIFIPVMLFFFFAFFNIPKLDEYLAPKYGQQFEEYTKKTKKLIPFIY